MRVAIVAASFASVAAFGAAPVVTCPSAPGADSYRDTFFVEVWAVTPGATLDDNAAIEYTMRDAVVKTQTTVQFPPGSGMVVPETTPGDNGNLNYEWYVEYDAAGVIKSGKVIHRYVYNDTPVQPMGPTGPTFKGAAFNIMFRHVVPDVQYWWARVQNPPDVNLTCPVGFPADGCRNSTAEGTAMFGANGQEWYNAGGFAGLISAALGPQFIKGETAFGFFDCQIKGKHANSDVMYDLVHFTMAPSAAATTLFTNAATPLAGTQAARGGIAQIPGTLGYEFFMSTDTDGNFAGGTVLGSYVSYSAYKNAVKWMAASFPFVTITSIEVYNSPAGTTAADLLTAGKYWGADASMIKVWGPRFDGYPVCGY